MFLTFFHELKVSGIPVTLKEYLTLMEAMDAGLARFRVEDFYHLSRAARSRTSAISTSSIASSVMSSGGSRASAEALIAEPARGMAPQAHREVSYRRREAFDRVLGRRGEDHGSAQERLAEQKGRHQGGNKWIGTAGTSPYGAYGFNPEGVGIGQDGNRNSRADQGVGAARRQGSR